LVVQTRFLVARARKQAPKPKRPGETFWASPSSFPQRDAGAQEWPAETAEARIGRRGTAAFFDVVAWVRAVRAGSIGRDVPRLEENTASPKWGAEAWPRPLHEDPSALGFQAADRPGPRPGPSGPLRRFSIHSDWPPVKGYP